VCRFMEQMDSLKVGLDQRKLSGVIGVFLLFIITVVRRLLHCANT
jgi:hypothetical protein